MVASSSFAQHKFDYQTNKQGELLFLHSRRQSLPSDANLSAHTPRARDCQPHQVGFPPKRTDANLQQHHGRAHQIQAKTQKRNSFWTEKKTQSPFFSAINGVALSRKILVFMYGLVLSI